MFLILDYAVWTFKYQAFNTHSSHFYVESSLLPVFLRFTKFHMAPIKGQSGATARQRAPARSLVSNQSAEMALGSHSTTARLGGSKLSQMNGPECLPLLFRRLLGSENVPACRNERAALEARLRLNNLLNFKMMQFKVATC